MRLDKLLAHSGFGTRKQVRKLIKEKSVTVNENIITDHGYQVNQQEDTVCVQGVEVSYQMFVYYMMHKPQGVISATEDALHETVIDLLEPSDVYHAPHPVGRLDIDTEGLLILTNDGKLTHRLTSPNKHVSKWYYAVIKGIVTEIDQDQFRSGVTLDDHYQTLPANLIIDRIDESDVLSYIHLEIKEGKFHQVKRMFQSVGKEVIYLKRVKMGQLALDEQLALGEYRELTPEEVALLQKA